jgi:hypothetical protein
VVPWSLHNAGGLVRQKPLSRHQAGKVVEVEHDAQLNHPTFVGCGTNVIRFCWLIARMGRMVDVAYGGIFELR